MKSVDLELCNTLYPFHTDEGITAIWSLQNICLIFSFPTLAKLLEYVIKAYNFCAKLFVKKNNTNTLTRDMERKQCANVL